MALPLSSFNSACLEIPTWFGLEVNTGYEQTRGVFLNPERNTPGSGLVYAGVGLNVGQGLFIDERRAQLRQAQIFRESTEAMRISMYNELLYEAGKAYWDWFMSYHVLRVFENAIELAEQRVDFVRRSAGFGDRASIDTLEAGIQLQKRQLSLQQSQLDYANNSARLSIFLWRDGEIPLEIDEGIRPSDLESTGVQNPDSIPWDIMDSLINNHPDLLQTQYKIDQMRIEQRWKREQLKPTLELKYNLLAEPLNNDPFSEFTTNNYKWGLQFEMPVFLRKERGAVLDMGVKINQTQFDFSNKLAELNFKANAARNELVTTGQQYNLYTRTVRDTEGLLNGERQLFRTGESSLFLVNRREVSFINAQIKLIELLSKNQKAALMSDYALGILFNTQ
jgi:outer membrane protein TolC